MKTPFVFVHNGNWYNPGDEVPVDAESALKSQIREREAVQRKYRNDELKKASVASNFRFKKV